MEDSASVIASCFDSNALKFRSADEILNIGGGVDFEAKLFGSDCSPERKALVLQWLAEFHQLSNKLAENQSTALKSFLANLNFHLLRMSFLADNLQTTPIDFVAEEYLSKLLPKFKLDVKVLPFPSVERWMGFIAESKGNTCGSSAKVKKFVEIFLSDPTPFEVQKAQPKPPQPAPEAKKGRDVKTKTETVKKDGKPAKSNDLPELSAQPEITKLEIRVGQIVEIKKHPEKDKLFVEKIKFSDNPADDRIVISGLVDFYPDPNVLLNKKVLVCFNLKPRKMGSVTSNGMVLCASTEGKTKVEVLDVPPGTALNEKISYSGFAGKIHTFEPWTPSKMAKQQVLEKMMPNMKTTEEGIPCWFDEAGKEHMFLTSKGECFAPTIKNGHVG